MGDRPFYCSPGMGIPSWLHHFSLPLHSGKMEWRKYSSCLNQDERNQYSHSLPRSAHWAGSGSGRWEKRLLPVSGSMASSSWQHLSRILILLSLQCFSKISSRLSFNMLPGKIVLRVMNTFMRHFLRLGELQIYNIKKRLSRRGGKQIKFRYRIWRNLTQWHIYV